MIITRDLDVDHPGSGQATPKLAGAMARNVYSQGGRYNRLYRAIDNGLLIKSYTDRKLP